MYRSILEARSAPNSPPKGREVDVIDGTKGCRNLDGGVVSPPPGQFCNFGCSERPKIVFSTDASFRTEREKVQKHPKHTGEQLGINYLARLLVCGADLLYGFVLSYHVQRVVGKRVAKLKVPTLVFPTVTVGPLYNLIIFYIFYDGYGTRDSYRRMHRFRRTT